MDKYLQILRAMHSGKTLSKADLSYFMSQHASFDEKKYATLKDKLSSEEGIKNMTDADFDNYVDQSKEMLKSDTYKDKVADLYKEAQAGKTSESVARGLNFALAGTDIATSLSQIGKSNQLLKNTQRPTRPAVLQKDAMLQQALGQAQTGTLDQSKALAPAQLGILDNYQSDLANAKTASAGQSGAYGAYAQVASNRRARANADLVPIANNIKQQEQNRYTELLGMNQQENANINQSQQANYGNDLYQYGVDRQAANELGSQGRANLRDSLTGFAAQIPGAVAQATRNKYDNIYNQMSAYGADHAKTAADAARAVDQLHNPQPAVTPQSDYEDAYGNTSVYR